MFDTRALRNMFARRDCLTIADVIAIIRRRHHPRKRMIQ
jgi:hypothetical protein